MNTSEPLKHYTHWHGLVMATGIAANMLFVLGLFFMPGVLLSLLHIPPDYSIWVRFSANLLFLLSVFYIPAIWDLQRYRANAWFAVFPARTFGTIFFTVAVFFFDQPAGFLVFAADLIFALAQCYLLIQVTREEKKLGLNIGMRSWEAAKNA